MTVLASVVRAIIRLVIGVAVIGGFLYLATRLISRMTRSEGKSPPGREPTDRIDDEDRKIF